MDINLPMNPPVNNNIQESVYDKLDAVAFEKTRVMNCQLDTRLSIQERMLNKYRRDVQRVHDSQSKQIRSEFKKIQIKKPDYVYDDTDLAMSRSRGSHHESNPARLRTQSETSVRVKGGHCRRYYAHHYHVKYDNEVKNKEDKTKREKTDFFNLKFKLFFYNTMKNIYNTQQRMKDEERESCQNLNLTHDCIRDIVPETPAGVLDDDVFKSPRPSEPETELFDLAEHDDKVHDDLLQNSTNSLWGRNTIDTNNNESPQALREGRPRKRGARTLRLYGSDPVLNHVHKKRESLDEKEFAKKREQWLQHRQSSDKLFSALS